VYPQGRGTEYYAYDGDGRVTDGSGNVQAKIDYGVWGIPTVTSYNGYEGSSDVAYTGKERDQTGLYYFNARYYDASLGRFITEDPARNGMNWFVYCGNNPLSSTDPTGLWEAIGAQNAAGDSADDRRQYRAYLDEERYSNEGYRHQYKINSSYELILISVTQKLGQEYIPGINDCDIWVEDVFFYAGINLSSRWGPARSTTVSGHTGRIADELSPIPDMEWNVFFQGYNHTGIIKVNMNGSVDIFHNGWNPDEIWESRTYHYISVEEFERRWSGQKVYWPIK